MKYQDNQVKFKTSFKDAQLAGGSLTIRDMSISSGQDPQHRNQAGKVVNLDGNHQFLFEVGRHGTKDVANWFSGKLPDNKTTFNHSPGDLNFAFLVDLSLTINNEFAGQYLFRNVMLAQGHAGASDNWWFGGSDAIYKNNWTVQIPGTVVLSSGDSGTATMNFLRGDAPWNDNEPNLVYITEITTNTTSTKP